MKYKEDDEVIAIPSPGEPPTRVVIKGALTGAWAEDVVYVAETNTGEVVILSENDILRPVNSKPTSWYHECECGARHTSFPQYHLSWCKLSRKS